ncbi:MAG: TIGR04013 family B12-binding domain/radical SAM domain-containing protein [bacterium]
MSRKSLLFRRTKYNRNSIAALIGTLDARPDLREWDLQTFDSIKGIEWSALEPSSTVVAFSFMTPAIGAVMREVGEVRAAAGNAITLIAGGPHPSADPDGTLRMGFDFAFVGEGEGALPEFLRSFRSGEEKPRIIVGGSPVSLDEYPPFAPSRGLFSPIEISRGCGHACRYCQTPSLFPGGTRYRSPERVAEYLEEYARRGGRKTWFISPDAFSYRRSPGGGDNLQEVESLLRAARGAGIEKLFFGSFPSEVRPDSVSEGALESVKRFCNNRFIVVGAQSGSDRILGEMRRGHTVADALRAVEMIQRAGFRPMVDFILGSPREEEEDRRASLDLMEEMIGRFGAKIHAHAFLPLPGSPWEGEMPSHIEPHIKEKIRKLERSGNLEGSWAKQEKLARRIRYWRKMGIISDRGHSRALS